jgi:uncharacterized damage-inducible protein DinB
MKVFRNGAIGALMDEYERATDDLKALLQSITDAEYETIADAETDDPDCRSIQTMMSHVINSGYGYADYIREQFTMPSAKPQRTLPTRLEALEQLNLVLAYTAATLDGKWQMTSDELSKIIIHTRWGVTLDMETLLEHAIVHILRHRRQSERFLQQLRSK